MLLVVAGSMVTRKYLCNVLVMQGLARRHFRAEFSAAPLKQAYQVVPMGNWRNFRAEFSAAPLKRRNGVQLTEGCDISALNSARPH